MFKLLKSSCSSQTVNGGLYGWTTAALQNNTIFIGSPFSENTVWKFDANYNILGHLDGSCSTGAGYGISTFNNDILFKSVCQSVSLYQDRWYNFALDFIDVKLCGKFVTVIASDSLQIFQMNSGVLTPVDYAAISATKFVCDDSDIFTFGNEITQFKIENLKLKQVRIVEQSSSIINAVLNDFYLITQNNDKINFYERDSLKYNSSMSINGSRISSMKNGLFVIVTDPIEPFVSILSRNLPGQAFSDESRFLKPNSGLPYYKLDQLYGSPNSGFGASVTFTDSNLVISSPLQNCFNVYSLLSSCNSFSFRQKF
eukprot:NODE_4_length_77007_cov_1.156642.p30 type:complete len:313 gc:universal NODE_4_length_77007_cov_1.156642:64417-63479(-)